MAVERPTRSQWPPSNVAAAAVPQSRSSIAGAVEAQGPAGAGLASQATSADILAKLIAAPATEATVASILAKILAAPATEAKQDTIITALAGLQTALDTANGHLATIATNTTPP